MTHRTEYSTVDVALLEAARRIALFQRDNYSLGTRVLFLSRVLLINDHARADSKEPHNTIYQQQRVYFPYVHVINSRKSGS